MKKLLLISILGFGLASCNITGVVTGLTIVNPTTETPVCKTVGTDQILPLSFNFAGTIKTVKLTFNSKKADGSSNSTQTIEFDVTSALKPTGVNWLLNTSNTVKLELNLQTMTPITTLGVTQPSPVTSLPLDIKIEAKDDTGKVSLPTSLEVKALNVASCYSTALQ